MSTLILTSLLEDLEGVNLQSRERPCPSWRCFGGSFVGNVVQGEKTHLVEDFSSEATAGRCPMLKAETDGCEP